MPVREEPTPRLHDARRQRTEADQAIALLEARYALEPHCAGAIACGYVLRHDAKRASLWLDRACAVHDVRLLVVRSWPWPRSRSGSRAVSALLRRMKLPVKHGVGSQAGARQVHLACAATVTRARRTGRPWLRGPP